MITLKSNLLNLKSKIVMPRPDLTRVPQFYYKYISLVKEDDLLNAFANETKNLFQFLDSIPESKKDYAYSPGKWTLKELLQHMIDSERVFAYRALSFSRKDSNKLPGFEEKDWAIASNSAGRNWNDLIEEFKTVRKSTEYLFASFNEEQLNAAGLANNNSIYVMAIGFICVGHANHHIGIIKERYL